LLEKCRTRDLAEAVPLSALAPGVLAALRVRQGVVADRAVAAWKEVVEGMEGAEVVEEAVRETEVQRRVARAVARHTHSLQSGDAELVKDTVEREALGSWAHFQAEQVVMWLSRAAAEPLWSEIEALPALRRRKPRAARGGAGRGGRGGRGGRAAASAAPTPSPEPRVGRREQQERANAVDAVAPAFLAAVLAHRPPESNGEGDGSAAAGRRNADDARKREAEESRKREAAEALELVGGVLVHRLKAVAKHTPSTINVKDMVVAALERARDAALRLLFAPGDGLLRGLAQLARTLHFDFGDDKDSNASDDDDGKEEEEEEEEGRGRGAEGGGVGRGEGGAGEDEGGGVVRGEGGGQGGERRWPGVRVAVRREDLALATVWREEVRVCYMRLARRPWASTRFRFVPQALFRRPTPWPTLSQRRFVRFNLTSLVEMLAEVAEHDGRVPTHDRDGADALRAFLFEQGFFQDSALPLVLGGPTFPKTFTGLSFDGEYLWLHFHRHVPQTCFASKDIANALSVHAGQPSARNVFWAAGVDMGLVNPVVATQGPALDWLIASHALPHLGAVGVNITNGAYHVEHRSAGSCPPRAYTPQVLAQPSTSSSSSSSSSSTSTPPQRK
jgi:hypothetical protein